MLLMVWETRWQSGYPTAGWTTCSASALRYRSAMKKRGTLLSAIQQIVLEGTSFNETRNKPGTERQTSRCVKVINV